MACVSSAETLLLVLTVKTVQRRSGRRLMVHQRVLSQSFGELLKTYRKRQRLTQKHLAQHLDVHMNTISSWELGTYLPATRGLVLELARCLALSEPETRQLLEASLTAL